MDEKTLKTEEDTFFRFSRTKLYQKLWVFFPKIPRFSNTKKANRHTVRSNNRLINYINFVKILYFYAR